MEIMPDVDDQGSGDTETATLAGGCFWCLEAVYDQMNGVLSVESGYIGGHVADPSYDAVCTGRTGHAEAVRITFDRRVTYRDVLEVFFAIHDPTTLNRQGNDAGTQYRSAIFYHSPEQKAIAEDVIQTLTREQVFDRPIVTEVSPATPFYMAEDYHQEYFSRNPSQPYCTYVVNPKIAKFRKSFAHRLKV
jgi:peptide-methionine (S)-S-oxide reductase